MKQWQFLTLTALSAICVALSLVAVTSGKSNQKLQTDLQLQQAEINRGSMSQQVGSNLVRDMAGAATKNDKIKDLLTKNGFTLTPAASPSPEASPKP